MARNGNPQLEDGFARIANETLEALARTALSDYESRCVHFLFRKTYGWVDKQGKAKRRDTISYGQWSDGMGIDRGNVRRALSRLVARRILKVEAVIRPGHNQMLIWEFNKHYLEWTGYEAKPSSTETTVPSQLSLAETTVQSQPSSEKTTLSFKVQSVEPKSVVSTDTTIYNTKEISSKDKKKTIKKVETFEEYAEKLKGQYPEFTADWPLMLIEFWGFWDSHDAKHTPHIPKSCLSNWMKKARRDAKEKELRPEKKGGNYGQYQGHSEPPGGRQATVEELRKSAEGLLDA